MSRRASSGKYEAHFIINVMKGAQMIIQEVSVNGRVTGDKVIGKFARARKGLSIFKKLTVTIILEIPLPLPAAAGASS